MGMTDYLANKVLDDLFGALPYTRPGTWYVGLFSVAPTDSAPGTELTIGQDGYARRSAAFGAASNRMISNNGAIQFPAASPNAWPPIVAVGLFEAATGGVPCEFVECALSVGANNSLLIAAGDLQISVSA